MSKALTIVIAAAILWWTGVWPGLCETDGSCKVLKLHASFTDGANVPKQDTLYRFLSEQAMNAYSDGDLEKAESTC